MADCGGGRICRDRGGDAAAVFGSSDIGRRGGGERAAEAEHVVAILKAEGRTVDAIYYPEEGHGFVKREHQQDELTRSVAWLQKYLQAAP